MAKDGKIELPAIGSAIREMQIEQTLTGLRLMPHMLSRLEAMAEAGDETSAEVVKRFKAAQ